MLLNKLKYPFTVILLLFLYSCSEDLSVVSNDEVDPNSLEWNYGKNEYNLEIDGEERNFIIHVPRTYTEGEELPVLFMLHGSSGTGTKFHNISGWKEKGEQENILTVYPTALEYRLIDGKQSTKWSSQGLQGDLAEGQTVKDDIPFIEGLVQRVVATFSVDEQRIYISGFSNGSGFVKSEVVPRLGHIFAAANATGGVGIPVAFLIQGNRTMPLFNISGSQDKKIFEQIGSNEELPLSGAEIEAHETLWSSLSTMCSMLNLELSYQETPNPPKWNLLKFDSGTSNISSEYLFMMVKDMEHVYPNGSNNPQSIIASDILWPWYLNHQLN